MPYAAAYIAYWVGHCASGFMKAGLQHRKKEVKALRGLYNSQLCLIHEKALIMYLLVVVISLLLSSVPARSRPVEVRTEYLKWKIISSAAFHWEHLFVFYEGFLIYLCLKSINRISTKRSFGSRVRCTKRKKY